MVRSIAGHGSVRTSRPVESSLSSLPSSSTTFAEMPGKGCWAEPGTRLVTPGSGVSMCAPVSVCHQVSMIGQRPPPMFLWYQSQASGLIGSPTEPSRRSEVRSKPAGLSSPHFMNVRMTVGAVYRIVTRYFSISSNQRPRCGVSGVPSYMTLVARLASGP
jgi:hypothetical protein